MPGATVRRISVGSPTLGTRSAGSSGPILEPADSKCSPLCSLGQDGRGAIQSASAVLWPSISHREKCSYSSPPHSARPVAAGEVVAVVPRRPTLPSLWYPCRFRFRTSRLAARRTRRRRSRMPAVPFLGGRSLGPRAVRRLPPLGRTVRSPHCLLEAPRSPRQAKASPEAPTCVSPTLLRSWYRPPRFRSIADKART